MKRIYLLLLFRLIFITPSTSQKSCLMVLGDLHYDLLEGHDMDQLNTKPDDLRQVTRNIRYIREKTGSLLREFCGKKLAVNVPDREPNNMEARKAMLAEEDKFVTFYKQTDLPGYALIKLDEKKGTVHLEYYAAFGKKAYDKVNLSRLLGN